MPTATEEQQAIEFLKRAEIKTMRKDLMALREIDALQERDKIVKLKTLEEQLAEKISAEELAKAGAISEKIGRQEILEKNAGEERIAEKDLKNYANEEERQRIFQLESQRLGFEKQVDEIDNSKDPALKLQKNKLLIKKREQESSLGIVLDEEKKLEDEQKLITEKQKTTTIASQREGLEKTRWELDEGIKNVEKKRWAAEKDIQETDIQISQIDESSEILLTEKNNLKNKILGVDKSLREIYSAIIAREEEKRKGLAAEQLAKKAEQAKRVASQKEGVQRVQWSTPLGGKKSLEEMQSFSNVSTPVKKNIMKSFEEENIKRKQFLEDVENWEKKEEGPKLTQVPIPPKKIK